MKSFILLVCFSSCYLPGESQQVYRNLVFEGGGIRGIAYAGVIRGLEEKGILDSIRQTAGSSAGAISALLVSLNYTAQETDSILRNLSTQNFNDGKWFFLGGQKRLRKQFGWYRGNAFENWIKGLIFYKTGSRQLDFDRLHELSLQKHGFKDFFCTGTNLSLQRVEVFSHLTTPKMQVSTAVRISMSIPLYFEAVFLDSAMNAVKPKKYNRENVYVDGGLLANYPLNIFDSCPRKPSLSLPCKTAIPNYETLGIKLERPDQLLQNESGLTGQAPYQISNIKGYVSALYNLVLESLNEVPAGSDEPKRTVYVNTSDITPRVRKLPVNEKETLVHNGYEAVIRFFSVKK